MKKTQIIIASVALFVVLGTFVYFALYVPNKKQGDISVCIENVEKEYNKKWDEACIREGTDSTSTGCQLLPILLSNELKAVRQHGEGLCVGRYK